VVEAQWSNESVEFVLKEGSMPRSTLLSVLSVLSVLSFAVLTLAAAGQTRSTARDIAVTITAPRTGATAGREVIVHGTAKMPDGVFLWLLARRTDFEPLWWPQRAVKLGPKTGEWAGTATLGNAADVNSDFDVAVITVDAAGNRVLQDYWTKAMTSADWKPIRIPDTTSPPRMIKVRKTSDR
jgi:hypothetical protein